MKKLQDFLNKIPQDKKNHIIVGLMLSTLIPMLGYPFGDLGALIGLIIGTGVNLWKELIHDKHQKKGAAELVDFVSTETPILIVYLTFLI